MPNPPLEAARRYLDLVREKTGLDYSNIARSAKLHTTTLTRPLSPKAKHKGRISLRTLRRISQVHGIPLPREVDPTPVMPPDDVDLAVAMSQKIQVGETMTQARKNELIREILALIQRRT